MSYILTALQKSEHERQQQELDPNLLIAQPEPIDSTSNSLKQRYLKLITLLLVACVCLLIYMLLRNSETPNSNPASASALASPVAPEVINSAQSSKTIAMPETATLAQTPDQTIATELPNRAPAKQASTNLDTRNNTASATPVSTVQKSTAPVSTAPVSTAPSINDLYQNHSAIDEETTTEVPNTEATVEQQLMRLRAEQIQREIAEPKVPTIYELAPQIQSQLPKMVYSAHVYSSDADSGFAIINDRRRYRGDRITANLVVVSVESNGIILSFQGETFRLGAMRNWPLE